MKFLPTGAVRYSLYLLCAVVQFRLLRVIPAVHRPHKIDFDAAEPLKLHAFSGALRIVDAVVFHVEPFIRDTSFLGI